MPRPLALLAAGLALALAPVRAGAQVCGPSASNDAQVLWSFPADGDTGIPTDSRIWVLVPQGFQAQVVLDGTTLGADAPDQAGLQSAVESFTPPAPFAPQTLHQAQVQLFTDFEFLDAGALSAANVQFTAGDGPSSGAPPAPVMRGNDEVWLQAALFELAPGCAAIFEKTQCIEPSPVAVRLNVPSGALGYRVERDNFPPTFWPASCGKPLLAVEGAGRDCITLHALSASGAETVAGPYCSDGGKTGCGSVGGDLTPLLALAALALARGKRFARVHPGR